MSLRGPYAPMRPELDPFLFASLDEEADGIPLSVLSALVRLGLDPRGEAARLSDLGSDAAADQLARTFARLPNRRWTPSELRRIAGGLVELLPPATKDGKGKEHAGDAGRVSARSSPFFYWALAGAVVICLVALSSLAKDSQYAPQPASQAGPQTRSTSADRRRASQ